MKRRVYTAVLMAALSLLVVSCFKDKDERLDVSPEQVEGLWHKADNPYEYWRFNAGGTGVTWDETPDPLSGEPEMTEDLSNLKYSWSVDRDLLSFDWRGLMENQDVPKYYYISAISSSSMTWHDDYGLTYTLNKVAAR